MTSDQFAYWLQGFFEMSGSNTLSEKQVRMIKEHLQLVFTKVTTDSNDDDTDKVFCSDIAARDELLTSLSPEEYEKTRAEAKAKIDIQLKKYEQAWKKMYRPSSMCSRDRRYC